MQFLKSLGKKPKTETPVTVGQQAPMDKGRAAEIVSPSSPKKPQELKDFKDRDF